MIRRIGLLCVALVVGFSAVPFAPSVGNADGLDGLVTAEAESYALRVEYDIPLPVGAGTMPHTVGEIRRTSAGENAKGVAASPTHFDAVVLGTYVNPNNRIKDPKNYNKPPQAECFYPGALVDTKFAFPTDTRDQTKALPPVSRAIAKCSAGPRSELIAAAEGFGGIGLVARNLGSNSFMRTEQGVDRSDTSAHASSIDIAAGAIKIGSVDIASSSSTTGKKGGAASNTRISINDIQIGGVKFSIADDQIVLANSKIPLGGNQAQSLIDNLNSLLLGRGCRVDVVNQPLKYPQGFLFSRPDPKVGVEADGTFAGSMRAGLLIVCDLPDGFPTKDLSPQRVQVVVGFAYSAVGATADPGGFNLGNLGGDGTSSIGLPSINTGGLPDLGGIGSPSLEPTTSGTKAEPKPVERITSPASRIIATVPLDGATRGVLLVVCLIAWAFLTHLGITRLRDNS